MPQRADRAYGNYNSRSLLAPRRGERGGEVWVWKWVGGFWQETAAGALSGVSASLVTLKEVHRAPHDRALQSSETNLCDFKTMTVRAARIVTSRKKKTRCARATPEEMGVPHCPCDLSPPPSASASDWTPRSSAPASGSPASIGSTAPEERDAQAAFKY